MHELDLELHFVGDNDGSVSIRVNKSEFITKCKLMQFKYFVTMLLSDNFEESTKMNIQIHVPFASVMNDIVRFIINGEYGDATANQIIKRIHCIDFFGMDTLDEFAKLLNMDIDNETYDLAHQFIDRKEYNNDSYINFLATKLPNNYDCSAFPLNLLQVMLDLTRHDILVFTVHLSGSIYIYYLDERRYVKFGVSYAKSTYYSINPAEPVVAIYHDACITLYNLFTEKIIAKISINVDLQRIYFSLDGQLLYVCDKASVHIYHLDNSYTKTIYPLCSSVESLARHIKCTPDRKFLIFYRTRSSNDGWYAINLSNGEINSIPFDNKSVIGFISGSVVIGHFNGECDWIMLYDLNDTKRGVVKKYIVPKSVVLSAKRKICHPNKNILISFKHSSSPFNGNGTLFFIDDLVVTTTKISTSTYKLPVTRNCFSHDGKYIYSILEDAIKCQISKYRFRINGEIKLKQVFPLDIDEIDNFDTVENICYMNQNILETIKTKTS